MSVKTLEDLFIQELSDIYNAEHQLTKALPKLARAATDDKLVQAFETHLRETERQIELLDKVFDACEAKPKRLKCAAMEGLIEEGQEIIDDVDEGALRDAALITAAQKVEHYEIAAYGSLVALAQQFGHKEAVRWLQEILDEEKLTDEKLTALAVGGINEMAQAA